MSEKPEHRSDNYYEYGIGGNCWRGTVEKPCWGDVQIADDLREDGLIYACEGHWDLVVHDDPYCPEPTN